MMRMDASVAQMVERRTEDPGVPRSTRGAGTACAVPERFSPPGEAGLVRARVAQSVEPPAHNREVIGSNPIPGTPPQGCIGMRMPGSSGCAGVAQTVERSLRKRDVAGSIPASGPVVMPTMGTTETTRVRGAIGSATALQAEGWEFKSPRIHQQQKLVAATAARSARSAGVAQLEELLPCKQRVAGSKPVSGPVAGTTGTTETAHGQVPERSKGPGRNPGSLARNTPGSNPGLPTGSTAGGSYCERVAEMVEAMVCNTMHAGSNPAALSGRNESRECCRAVVERYNTRLSSGMVGVQVPSALLLRQQAEDTTARAVRACRIGIEAVRQPSKLETGVRFSHPAPETEQGFGGITAQDRVLGARWTGQQPSLGQLVQLDRAPDSKSGRWGFESLAARSRSSVSSSVIVN